MHGREKWLGFGFVVLGAAVLLAGCENLFGSGEQDALAGRIDGVYASDFVTFTNGHVEEKLVYSDSYARQYCNAGSVLYQHLLKRVRTFRPDGTYRLERFVYEPDGEDLNENGDSGESWIEYRYEEGEYNYDIDSKTLLFEREKFRSNIYGYRNSDDEWVEIWKPGSVRYLDYNHWERVLFTERAILPAFVNTDEGLWERRRTSVFRPGESSEITRTYVYTYNFDLDNDVLKYRSDFFYTSADVERIKTYEYQLDYQLMDAQPEMTVDFELNTPYSFYSVTTRNRSRYRPHPYDENEWDDWREYNIGYSRNMSFLMLDEIMVETANLQTVMRSVGEDDAVVSVY